MPISPEEVFEDNYDYIKGTLFDLIDYQLKYNNLIFEVPQNLDNEEVIKEIIKDYSSLGWVVKWYPSKRIVRHQDKKAKLITKTLVFEKAIPSRRPNSKLTGR